MLYIIVRSRLVLQLLVFRFFSYLYFFYRSVAQLVSFSLPKEVRVHTALCFRLLLIQAGAFLESEGGEAESKKGETRGKED